MKISRVGDMVKSNEDRRAEGLRTVSHRGSAGRSPYELRAESTPTDNGIGRSREKARGDIHTAISRHGLFRHDEMTPGTRRAMTGATPTVGDVV